MSLIEPVISDASDSEMEIETSKDPYTAYFNTLRNYPIEQLKQMFEIGKNVIASTKISLNDPLSEKLDNLLDTSQNINNGIQCLMNNSSKKGKMGENMIYNHLRCILPAYCVELISKTKNQADIHVKFRERLIIIDTKLYDKPVPSCEIDKLKKDAKETNCSMAFLISLTSGIQTIEETIQMERVGDQTFVYISNMDSDQIISIFMGLINYNDLIRNLIENNNVPSNVQIIVQQMNLMIDTVQRSVANYNKLAYHVDKIDKNLKELSNDYIKCQEMLTSDINNIYQSVQQYSILGGVHTEFKNKTDQEKREFYYGNYIHNSMPKSYRLLMIHIGNYLYDNNFDVKIIQNGKFYDLNIYKNGNLICKSETKKQKKFKCMFVFDKTKFQLLSTKLEQIMSEFKKH